MPRILFTVANLFMRCNVLCFVIPVRVSSEFCIALMLTFTVGNYTMQAHPLTSIALSINTLWVLICPFGWVSVGSSREVSPILCMITFCNIGTIKQKTKITEILTAHDR